MEAPDGSPPQSLCMIRAAELFPKSQMEKEDTHLTVPYKELDGESVRYLGRTDDGILALSNYRLFLLKNSNNSETSVPLRLIEIAQIRDLFHLLIYCKDASTVKCSFETAEQCTEWQRRIQLSIGIPETLESLFAFPFCSWTGEVRSNGNIQSLQNGQNNGYSSENLQFSNTLFSMTNPVQQDAFDRLQRAILSEDDFLREVERLGFDLNGPWRITTANHDFKLCPSYPQKLLVPCCIADDTLQTVANFRASRRLPAVVWRHRKTGAVIARCSQPEVGWLGWRNYKDEQLLKALADACAFDRGEQIRKLVPQSSIGNCDTLISAQSLPSDENSPTSLDGSHEEVTLDEVRKVLIVDARSYTSAVTNRARGGGCECIEYYPCAEIEFMNLGNIHVIRKSFNALRALCATPGDVPNWLGTLERSNWLQHLSGLLAASMTVCHAIDKKGRPVLVHCSDGWDRTPQIVATAELCLDPYYRTVEGFRILVEREWLSFGHKFADRCGHGPNSDEVNERCPVFLQWLDLVHQIHKQFPCAFEFSMAYLIKLAQHSLSCLFGTFLCNTLKERIDNSVFERTFSVWPFLSDPMYLNPLYVPHREKVLWPAYNVRDLALWTEVYLGSLGNQNSTEFPSSNIDGTAATGNPMIKTRSYGDLISGNFLPNGLSRRSSDPNMTVDPNLTTATNSENNSVADIQSEREDSPDLIANIAHDTSRKLQDLTTELNNEGEIFLKSIANLSSKVEDEEESIKTISVLKHPQNLMSEDSLLDEHPEKIIPKSTESISSLQNTDISENREKQAKENETIGCDYYENSNSTSNNSTNLSENLITSTQQIPDKEEKSINLNETINNKLNIFNELSKSEQNDIDLYNINTPRLSDSVQVLKNNDGNIDLMKSVDLSELNCINSENCSFNGRTESENVTTTEQSLWHNSVNTSTDTLVPIEHKQLSHQSSSNLSQISKMNDSLKSIDDIDGAGASLTCRENPIDDTQIKKNFTKAAENINSIISKNSDLLPKVHNIRPNSLMNEMTNTNHDINIHSDDNNKPQESRSDPNPPSEIASNLDKTSMEESIMILPLHQKLEISLNGKCETVSNNYYNNLNSGNNYNPIQNIITTQTPPNSTTSTPFMNGIGFSAQRRQRTLSSNSRRDGLFSQKFQTNGSTTSRFSLPGIRSLPLTPPGNGERQQLALSCPDGLTHALSEQNIRLQQIVYEHKLREEVLRRELHDMRIALLRKQCPSCNNATIANDEQIDDESMKKIRKLCSAISNKIQVYPLKCQLRQSKWEKTKREIDLETNPNGKIRQSYCFNTNCDKKECLMEVKSIKVSSDHQNNDDNNNHHQFLEECNNYDDAANNRNENSGNINDCGKGSDNSDEDGVDDESDFDSSSASSVTDNVENASICSWEAVDDRSGPSSCTSSSTLPNASSVLWVPDHAVSRCTSCQIEFWLGRRKHHCRSCGQIFCADCSEFWAPLPLEKLFTPVRLCGPCYHTETTRMQMSQYQNNAFLQHHLQQQNAATKGNTSVVLPTQPAPATASSKA